MAAELTVVDTLKDKHNRTVKVGHRGGNVEIIVTPHSGHDGRMAFDPVGHERFMKANAEAARQAAGNVAPAAPSPAYASADPVEPAVRDIYQLDETGL